MESKKRLLALSFLPAFSHPILQHYTNDKKLIFIAFNPRGKNFTTRPVYIAPCCFNIPSKALLIKPQRPVFIHIKTKKNIASLTPQKSV